MTDDLIRYRYDAWRAERMGPTPNKKTLNDLHGNRKRLATLCKNAGLDTEEVAENFIEAIHNARAY